MVNKEHSQVKDSNLLTNSSIFLNHDFTIVLSSRYPLQPSTQKDARNRTDLVGINLFDLSVNKVINQFMAFLGLCI